MKLGLDQERRVDLNGLEVKNYGIGSIAAFQQVARSSMYSDPSKACLQEYLSNGIDAMRERHRSDPSFEPDTGKLEVHFSTSELRIQDCGIGISPERMENGFASYYGSTKRDSDDEIGGFGLGCKTAFADPNRDSFTVDTVYADNGIKRRYVTYHFIDGSGLTSYAELSNTEAPDDDLGTTIILPIDESDLETYVKVLISLCKHWERKPIVSGYEMVWPEVPKLFWGEGWIITDSKELEVVIDGIPYRVSQNQLPSKYTNVVHSGAVLFFNTGEISVTSTRESLDYRGDTIARITERLDDIITYLEEKAMSSIESLGLWEAQMVLRTIKAFLGGTSVIPASVLGHSIRTGFDCFLAEEGFGSVSLIERDFIDYATKFTVLLTRTKKVNRGRVASFLKGNPNARAYIIRVPNHRGGHYFTGDDGLRAFIDYLRKEKPEMMIDDIIDPRYDLQSWPVDDSHKVQKVRKKITKSALVSIGGKWAWISAEELEALKNRKDVYYSTSQWRFGFVRTDLNLKDLRGQVANPPKHGVIPKSATFVLLDEDQVESAPEGWKPYFKTVSERLAGRLEKKRKVLSELRNMPASELPYRFRLSISESLFKRYASAFPDRFKSLLSKINRSTRHPMLVLSDHFAVIKAVRPSSLGIKLIKSYKGKGGIYDRSAFSKLTKAMREDLLNGKPEEIKALEGVIRSHSTTSRKAKEKVN